MKLQGLRTPHYNRRADLVCFVNGLPLVFIELKAVYINIRAGFDGNLSDYFDTIPHAFHHNAFLIVSNGDNAKYGSITSLWEHFYEWKRLNERDKGRVDAETLLNGMLAKDRLLDILENFVLYDESRGKVRKIVARNHQVLGVNCAVKSVEQQEKLKKEIPPEKRLQFRLPKEQKALPNADANPLAVKTTRFEIEPLLERAHPDLGRLGVFWHTQGSGKSYSMAFFAEKVRRTVPGNFTFVIVTDRDDLDDQIYRTFIGCGIADQQTPRAASGKQLAELLKQNHRYVFTLIHKFNQEVSPEMPYSKRDDIIVISDEAHRTQAGKYARNLRIALPLASFIGFTGTPLLKYDNLTRRIFGSYVSRYDFKRSEEDGATVKLVYENRGEKLGLALLDLNDRIADQIAEAEMDPDQQAKIEKLLGKDYEVITAPDRLDKIADDFMEHVAARWESGKSMLVCIDKPTCAQMLMRIQDRWPKKLQQLRGELALKERALAVASDDDSRERLAKEFDTRARQIAWLDETIVEIIVSEEQNEVKKFRKIDFDIIPHRERMKKGFELANGRTATVEEAFKDDKHPFRVAVVCAMWLTGFDVECLSTLYIDKPMKAHTLMQAIARANRVYPGKACGVIVDYNGMLKSLRKALAQYALGDAEEGDPGTPAAPGQPTPGGKDGVVVVEPLEVLVESLIEAIEAAEAHLNALGFDALRLKGARGFDRIEALRDAVNALYSTDEAKRRYEIIAREVFSRFKALVMEPAAYRMKPVSTASTIHSRSILIMLRFGRIGMLCW